MRKIGENRKNMRKIGRNRKKIEKLENRKKYKKIGKYKATGMPNNLHYKKKCFCILFCFVFKGNKYIVSHVPRLY